MPFLRALRLKKNAAHNLEEKLLSPPVVDEPKKEFEVPAISESVIETPVEEIATDEAEAEEISEKLETPDEEIISEAEAENPVEEIVTDEAEAEEVPQEAVNFKGEIQFETEVEAPFDEFPVEENEIQEISENIETPVDEIVTDESEAEEISQENTISEAVAEEEIEISQDKESEFDENSLLDENSSETVVETPDETDSQPEEFHLMYDFTSGERYVDKVSTKTEFDKMLDELTNISKDLLSWQVEKFAKQYTDKFHPDDGKNEISEADAKKYEAFLGGYITNAAMTLYDKGYRELAIKQLQQAESILAARKKLEDETLAIKTRVEEEDAAVDLSDILGLFGDG